MKQKQTTTAKIILHSTPGLRDVLNLDNFRNPGSWELLFYPPFRTLVHCQDFLRQSLRLEEWPDDWRKEFLENPPDTEGDDDRKETTEEYDGVDKWDDVDDNKTHFENKHEAEIQKLDLVPSAAVREVRLLLDFMDEHALARHAYLDQDPPPHSVTFFDLWHILKPGTRVIDKSGTQVYLVVQVVLTTSQLSELRNIPMGDSDEEEDYAGWENPVRPRGL